MIRRVVSLALPFLCFVACGGPKAPVTVVVSVDRVAEESALAKRVRGEVEEFAKTVQTNLNQAAEQIQAAASDPRRNPSEIASMKGQWMQLRQQAQDQINGRRAKAEDQVHQALDKVLATLAKEQGWDLVLRKDRHAALWAAETLDRTDLVIQRMNSLPAAPATPAP